jgi:hypothetical protein
MREYNESAVREEERELFVAIGKEVGKANEGGYGWGEGVPLVGRDPEKAIKVLYRLARGCSMRQVIKEEGISYAALCRLRNDFADRLGKWKEMGGEISGRLHVGVAALLEVGLADMMEQVIAKEKVLDTDDIKNLTRLFEATFRQSMLARGEASQQIKFERVATIEDVEAAAKEAMSVIKEAGRVVDITEDTEEDD